MKKKQRKTFYHVAVMFMAIVAALAFVIPSYAEFEMPGDGEVKGYLGVDGKSFRQGFINSICIEGTSDTYETCIYGNDPTADNSILVPNESGTILTTGGGGITSLPLADTKIWIGGSDGLADPQTMSGDATITNAGVVTVGKVDNKAVDFATVTDGYIQVATDVGGGSWDAVAVSGDVTLANSGAVTIGDNKVGTAEANINSVSLIIPAGSSYNSVAVESGSTLMGWYITTYGAINQSTWANAPSWDGSTLAWSLNGTDGSTVTTMTATFLRP